MAILVSQNNETVATLVSQSNPVAVEFLFYANIDAGHVSENTLNIVCSD